jgi:hypothetical protein
VWDDEALARLLDRSELLKQHAAGSADAAAGAEEGEKGGSDLMSAFRCEGGGRRREGVLRELLCCAWRGQERRHHVLPRRCPPHPTGQVQSRATRAAVLLPCLPAPEPSLPRPPTPPPPTLPGRVANFSMVAAKEDEAATAALLQQQQEAEAAELQRQQEEAAAAAAAATTTAPLSKDANADFWRSLLGDKYVEVAAEAVGGAPPACCCCLASAGAALGPGALGGRRRLPATPPAAAAVHASPSRPHNTPTPAPARRRRWASGSGAARCATSRRATTAPGPAMGAATATIRPPATGKAAMVGGWGLGAGGRRPPLPPPVLAPWQGRAGARVEGARGRPQPAPTGPGLCAR